MPQFEPAFKELGKNRFPSHPPSCTLPIATTTNNFQFQFPLAGQLVVKVGTLVARQCDLYTKRVLGANIYNDKHSVERVVRESNTCKARALYYFPRDDDAPRSRDSWCGWHNDHGALTGLCAALYMDDSTGNQVTLPDPQAGLWAKSRDMIEKRITFPADHLAFQIGESSQIITGGVLRATPHAVQALRFPDSKVIGRSTFAVFMQPKNDFTMEIPKGRGIADVHTGQFRIGQTFADFSKATVEYYTNGTPSQLFSSA